jgi:putative phosphoserine phosphatase / 1-acylglycerol-3-phosphate O-acyltransferase
METRTKNYVAFFDLDRTIISLNSGSLLVRQAYKQGVMSTGNLINAVFQSYLYKFNLRDTNLIISKMGTWLKGIPYAVIEKLSKELVDRYLIESIRPEIITEINNHRKENALTVILSSAIATICEPIGNHLGVDDIICTTMETSEGILTGNPVGKFCFEDEKRNRLISYCEKNHCDLSNAWYYADSISDFPVLEVVGNPVCVSPDKKLARLANINGWTIYDW